MAGKMRVRRTDDTTGRWTVANGGSLGSSTDYAGKDGGVSRWCITYPTKAEAEAALALYLEKQEETHTKEKMREFEHGATRDTAQGKLDYVKALSPIVLRRYVQYLDKHRLLPDGSYREFDNWKQGIPQDVYHSSNGRHFFDAWLLTEGYTTEDNHGPVTLEDALCAELFNIMGRLHEILKPKESTPCHGGGACA